MKNFMRLSIVAVLLVASVLTGVSIAQETPSENGGSGFRISPTRDEVTVEQGTSVSRTIKVRNVTNVNVSARAVVDDFGPSDDESGTPDLLIGEKAVDNYAYSLKSFVASIPDLTLEPGEERDIVATFTVPSDASPGSYYGVVRFVSLNDVGEVEGQAAVGLNASIGTIFLVQVPGETIDLLSLEEAGAVKDGSFGRLFSSAPDAFAFRLSNEGNTFQAPFGTVKVKDFRGNVVQEYEFNDSDPRGNVLPGSVRRFEKDLEGIGSFGRYTVEAFISYGDGSQTLNSTTTFWVVPWAQLGVGLVVLIGGSFMAVKGIKRYNKKIIADSKGTRVKKK